MYCKYCNSKIKDTDVFCSNCGNLIKHKQDNKKYLIIGMVSMTCVVISVLIALFVFKINMHEEPGTYVSVSIVTGTISWGITLLYQLIALTVCIIHNMKLKRHNKIVSRYDKIGLAISAIALYMSISIIICYVLFLGFLDFVSTFNGIH